MFTYMIFGIQSGDADGLPFRSCVKDLQDKRDLWLDECPYQMPRTYRDSQNVWMEVVGVEPAPSQDSRAIDTTEEAVA